METQKKLIPRFTGKVLKSGNDKTIIVGVTWFQKHRLYNKRMRKLTKLVAHDEENVAQDGDTVLIESTRPLSATKCWRLVNVVETKKVK